MTDWYVDKFTTARQNL